MNNAMQYAGLIVLSMLLAFLAVKFMQPKTEPHLQPENIKLMTVQSDVPKAQPEPLNTPSGLKLSPKPLSADILQEREAVYLAFAAVSEQLSHGQAVNEREVDVLLQRQQALVQAGAVTVNEAVSYSQFLKKALPDMARNIDLYILSLEQQNKS